MDDTDPQDVDYSGMKSIADEDHWIEFAPKVGGELISPLITKENIKNADFLFRGPGVIAELKILETEFAHSSSTLTKLDFLIKKYPGQDPDDPNSQLRRELLSLLKQPLQRIIKKANRQIRETKVELKMPTARGILVCVNDNYRGLPPGFVIGLISDILAGPNFSSVDAVIYQTNHYVEIAESPNAVLLWSPLYSPNAPDNLVDFVNDLGRSWRSYSESIEGPYDSSEERESIDLTKTAVVKGIYRTHRFEG